MIYKKITKDMPLAELFSLDLSRICTKCSDGTWLSGNVACHSDLLLLLNLNIDIIYEVEPKKEDIRYKPSIKTMFDEYPISNTLEEPKLNTNEKEMLAFLYKSLKNATSDLMWATCPPQGSFPSSQEHIQEEKDKISSIMDAIIRLELKLKGDK